MSRQVLLDCDPGHDDAVAILLAAGSPEIELLGITTVAGNQTLDKTTRNALAVATIGGIGDVPVAAGHDRPLVRSQRTAPAFHGESGLDGPAPVVPDREPRPGHAVDCIVETIMSAPGEVTLVATGPLTNVASALRREPRIAEAARELVVMGGAYGRGNVTQTAEFNVFVDPEAAAIAFGAPWSVTMVGLDLTHQAGCTEEVQRRIGRIGTPVARFTVEMLEFFRRAYRREKGLEDPPLHDPCAVAYVIAPDIFETRPAGIEVELAGTLTAGTTVVHFAGPGAAGSSAGSAAGGTTCPDAQRHRVPVRIDAGVMFDMIVDAIERLG